VFKREKLFPFEISTAKETNEKEHERCEDEEEEERKCNLVELISKLQFQSLNTRFKDF
jgi:hypothetical protein